MARTPCGSCSTGLLLNSGNDTAQALARAMGGDAATVAAMTDKARQLGALDTRPATPSGLDGPGMATSAYDLAVLFRHAMGEPLFAETIATREIPFPGYGDRPGFVLSNANPLLARYPGTLGSKTGFTDAARHTIVAAAERNGRRLVVSLVRAENTPVVNWRQAAALLDYGFALPADRSCGGNAGGRRAATADGLRRHGGPGRHLHRPGDDGPAPPRRRDAARRYRDDRRSRGDGGGRPAAGRGTAPHPPSTARRTECPAPPPVTVSGDGRTPAGRGGP